MSIESARPTGFWMEPGLTYWSMALDELGLDQGDLERVPVGEWFTSGFPAGVYLQIDALYAKAWELRSEDR